MQPVVVIYDIPGVRTLTKSSGWQANFVPILLNIQFVDLNVILSWPTNFTGFTLQSTTNLASPDWTTDFPAPVVVNGQNTVPNPISGGPQFFRLAQ